jgi:ATP-dependent RNA helicase RhlE
MSFTELGLSAPLLEAIAATGYTEPTPIQKVAIPPALRGRDVLGCAQTGTGKTAAFSLPLLQLIHARSGEQSVLRGLVLAPTRELAAQIGESIATYGSKLDLWHTVVFGGVSDKPQIAELKQGVDILVATPGRLLDLMNRRLVDLSKIEICVLDELDRMLDMGFVEDVRKVVRVLPKKRQTLMFSATVPATIKKLADTFLLNPVHVAAESSTLPLEQIAQSVYFADKQDKRALLVDLLRRPEHLRTIVFTRTKHGADRVMRHLAKAGSRAAALHGDKSQGARLRALEGFKSGEIKVLVATDVAARGIDVDGVTHVINYELPNVPETYMHRIGRTARAGNTGIAISFCQEDEQPYLAAIERLTAQRMQRVTDHAYAAGSRPRSSEERAPEARPRPPQQRGGRPQQREASGNGRPGARGKSGPQARSVSARPVHARGGSGISVGGPPERASAGRRKNWSRSSA